MVLKEVFRATFSDSGPALTTGATWPIRPTQEQEDMYAPFNTILVFNDSDEKLKVQFNGDATDYIIVDPKTTFGTTLDDGKNYYIVDITNLSATNCAADEVRVRIARTKDVKGVI